MKPRHHHNQTFADALFGTVKKTDDRPLSKPKWRWWDHGNCAGLSDEEAMRIFFPIKKHQVLEDVYAEAHAFCKDCPVRVQCRDAAIDEGGRRQYGYQGDMDHRSRKQLFYDRKHRGEISPNYRPDDGVRVARKKHKKHQPSEKKNDNGIHTIKDQ